MTIPSEIDFPAPAREAAPWWRNLRTARPPRLNLALQGGGAHGAFTWDVLDALLQDDRLAFEGLSGTSAGAINAAVMAHGWMQGGRVGACAALTAFWTVIGKQMSPAMVTLAQNDGHMDLSPGSKLLATLTDYFSRWQFNPLDLNPVRDRLVEQVNWRWWWSPSALQPPMNGPAVTRTAAPVVKLAPTLHR